MTADESLLFAASDLFTPTLSGAVLLPLRPKKALVVQWENKCVWDLVQYVNRLTSVFGLSLWEHLRQLPYKFPVLRKQEQKVPFLYGSVPWRETDLVVPHLEHHSQRLGKVKSGMENWDSFPVCLQICSAQQQTALKWAYLQLSYQPQTTDSFSALTDFIASSDHQVSGLPCVFA